METTRTKKNTKSPSKWNYRLDKKKKSPKRKEPFSRVTKAGTTKTKKKTKSPSK